MVMASQVPASQSIESGIIREPERAFPPGYPRYSALLGAHGSFHNFRRFARVRMRLLLIKQNEISVLEEKLDSLDASETRGTFLGSIELDGNPERASVLQDLKLALDEYDKMLIQNHDILRLPQPLPREVQNLKDWTAGTGCISRRETAYLNASEDLVNLTGVADTAIAYSESLIEDCLLSAQGWLGDRFPEIHKIGRQIQREDHVLLLGPHLRRLSRIVAIAVATAVILVPTVVLPNISSLVGRLTASVVSATVFLLVISFFTEARTVDLFASGASYAAVLVALTMGNSDQGGGQCCNSSSQ